MAVTQPDATEPRINYGLRPRTCPYTSEIAEEELAPALAETAATRIEANSVGISVYAPADTADDAAWDAIAACIDALFDWGYRSDADHEGYPEDGEIHLVTYRLRR